MKKSMCPYPASEDPKGNAETRHVRLTQGKFTTVDAEDFDWVMRLGKWYAVRHKGHWYAACRQNGKVVYMHRVLTFAQPGEVVDHVDGDGLNNRQKNLRRCAPQENSRGFRRKARGKTSRFRGVSWHKSSKKWLAGIVIRPGVSKNLGYFVKEEDASRAYCDAVRLYFGAFAGSNIFSQELLSR